jgi:HD-like signal output (HDOD) protein
VKKRILFVDDEPNVLQGLQRLLRPMRHDWDMTFVGSGQEALTVVEQVPCDAVVSDMRMPHMDGAQLLVYLKERHPHIVRILLSGYADRDALFRAAGVAHRYLSKPCEAAILQETITHACALHALLTDDPLRQLVAGMQTLPSLPTLYHEVIAAVHAPHGSLAQVGKLIERDLGMSAKILQLVNSAFFGLHRRITSASQAVSLLGLNTVAGLILSSHLFASFDLATTESLALDALWRHSLATAACARAVARAEHGEPKLVEDAFMAGLLHDTGKLVFAANLPHRYGQARALAQEQGVAEWQAEQTELGASHAEVGAYLLGLWGLPASIVEALAFHHRPLAGLDHRFSPLTAVHVANALAHTAGAAAGAGLQVDHEYLAALGLSHRLADWQAQCQQALAEGEQA